MSGRVGEWESGEWEKKHCTSSDRLDAIYSIETKLLSEKNWLKNVLISKNENSVKLKNFFQIIYKKELQVGDQWVS